MTYVSCRSRRQQFSKNVPIRACLSKTHNPLPCDHQAMWGNSRIWNLDGQAGVIPRLLDQPTR
jgi:hypothetical protein